MTIHDTGTEERAQAPINPASEKSATIAADALHKGHASDRVDQLMAIAEHCAALPVLDARDADEMLGYDDYGLPGQR